LTPPVLPGDIGRGDEPAVLMLGDELDEPPRPAQRPVDPRLVRGRDLLHQHRIIDADADRSVKASRAAPATVSSAAV
jgi:hypothetical protein